MLEPIDLPTEATVYLRSCLLRGNHLASLLTHLPLHQGRIRTFLPSEADQRAVLKFDVGGMAKRRETEPQLVGAIVGHLRGPDKPIAILEDPLARPGDPVLRSSLVPFFTYHDEVYYFLTNQQTQEEIITVAIRKAGSYPFICALTESGTADVLTFQRDRQIADATLEALARNTATIIVGAYDGEAYLFWTRPSTC